MTFPKVEAKHGENMARRFSVLLKPSSISNRRGSNESKHAAPPNRILHMKAGEN